MVENPRFAEAMMDKSKRLAIEMNRVFLDEVGEYLDLVFVGDDLGHQHGLIVSPKMFRSMVKPRVKRIYQDIRRRSPHVKILYHSCGAHLADYSVGHPADVDGHASALLMCILNHLTEEWLREGAEVPRRDYAVTRRWF